MPEPQEARSAAQGRHDSATPSRRDRLGWWSYRLLHRGRRCVDECRYRDHEAFLWELT